MEAIFLTISPTNIRIYRTSPHGRLISVITKAIHNFLYKRTDKNDAWSLDAKCAILYRIKMAQ